MTDATSIVPTQVLSRVLSDATAVLFGLEEEFSGLALADSVWLHVRVVKAITPTDRLGTGLLLTWWGAQLSR